MDPDDVGLVAVPCARIAVDVELPSERLVRQQRRHDHCVAALARELVGGVARAAEEDPELPVARRPRDDVRVLDLVVGPVVREALVLERVEQDSQRLVVASTRLLDGNPGLVRDPRMSTTDAELVAAVDENVECRDLRREHGRIVVREHVHERPKVDVPRALRGFGEERERVR
jgi:hypothetical protein